MSKRNFILLIIVLTIILVTLVGFFYLQQTNTPNDNTDDSNFNFDFNPFNNSTSTPPEANNPVDVSGYIPPTSNEEASTSKLAKISTMPVAGFTIFMKERFKDVPAPVETNTETSTVPTTTKTTKPTPPPREFVPAIRYVARATGNIYQTFADKIEERRFSNTTIPKVYDAYFGNNGESVVMRYLKSDERTISSFVGALPKELLGGDTTENNEIKGVFLPENVKDISISPDTLKIFYLFNSGENTFGVTSDYLGNKKVQIFDSEFNEWLSSWANTKMITLNTKPSGNTLGYVYSIDPNKKDLVKIFGDINGLTSLASPDGKKLLYSDNNLALSIYHLDTRESTLLGVKTFSEKCIWNKTSEMLYCAVPKNIPFVLYPDAWYKGEVSFNDEIWQINLNNNNATKIIDPAPTRGEEIDGTKLFVDAGENHLLFVNKKDSYLWKLDLK